MLRELAWRRAGVVSSPMSLDDSGERVHVVSRPRTHNELAHYNRYRWAAANVSGRVLDAACGTGYGTRILSSRAIAVSGVDYHEAAIKVARETVPGTFVVGRLPDLPWPNEDFDAVVSFETIEHIADDVGFLREIRRVLVPGGKLLLSTPNREREGAEPNPWHVREYALAELRGLLFDSGFSEPEVFCQAVHSPDRFGRQLARVVARFPLLCAPNRFWDAPAHGRDLVVRWSGQPAVIWVLATNADGQ